jgi:hypothetical protein
LLEALMRSWVSVLALALAPVLLPASTFAAGIGEEARGETNLPPEDGGFTQSLGMPPVYKGKAGIEGQWYEPGEASQLALYLNLGLGKDLGSPVVGIAGLAIEGYGGLRGGDLDGGGRAMFTVPTFGLGLGADYNILDDRVDMLVRLDLPIRRGGIFGAASMLSLRWLPTREHTFGVGISLPTWGPNLGRTRPERDYVRMDDREPQELDVERTDPSMEAPLEILRERVTWIARLSQPFAERSGADAHRAVQPDLHVVLSHWKVRDALFPDGHTLNEEIRVYHDTLDRLFSLAVLGREEDTEFGRRVSRQARRILLDEVLHPYNAFLGQRKGRDTLSGQIAVAQAKFARWLLSRETPISSQQARNAFYVFQSLCDYVEETRRELKRRWEDSRFVYLPLQLGLKPEDHDTQEELDAIVAQAAGQDFSSGNQVMYLLNEDFQWALASSVRDAEDYHVTWIHDIRGKNAHGDPDWIAFIHVANYLRAMIDRVKAYDRTGTFPVYMIFLDQHYFEINKSRVWLRLLREPLDHRVDLPKQYKKWEERLQELQEELRTAVSESVLLQVERSQFGDKWLKNRIRVHINITNPADHSFRSWHVAGIVPIPDSMMRDHRKIVFYDVTEEDPYRGFAMFTGMGIGEHYVGPNWEDRAIILEGPEALEVKRAAHQLLENQGFADDEIPYPLRPRPLAENYDELVAERLRSYPDWIEAQGRVLQVHSETGFNDKPINPAKAALYSLMPKGSVLKIPDSLWQSYIYGSLLAGSAMRGCRVLVISPSLRSAPSAAPPTMARAHGLMGRLISFSNAMQDQIEAEGGLLKVGLYHPQQGVGDIAGRFTQAVNNEQAWGEHLYRLDDGFLKLARNTSQLLDSLGYTETYLADADTLERPKMHLKANLLASGEAWDALLQRPEWEGVLRAYIKLLAAVRLNPREQSEGVIQARRFPPEMRDAYYHLLRAFVDGISEEEADQVILYLSVGSVNMDYRSMVMDGEVMILLSKWASLQGMIDFLLLAGLCEWPETTEELDTLLPPPGGFTRSTAGLLKLAL